MKAIFHPKLLHLGHIAKAFALRLVPTELGPDIVAATAGSAAGGRVKSKKEVELGRRLKKRRQAKKTAEVTAAETVMARRKRLAGKFEKSGNVAKLKGMQRLAGPAGWSGEAV